MALILGVETSGLEGVIALTKDAALLSEMMLDRTKRRHAQSLVADVQQLLRRHDFTPSEVDVVATSIGPGSFTGLRVGVVFAKTFCFVTGARLVAVDTLLAAAAAAPDDVTDVSAVADAMRDELFVGRYQRGANGQWERVGPIFIQSNEDWLASCAAESSSHFAVTGPGLVKLKDAVPPAIRRLEETQWTPRAGVLCELARQLAARHEFADPMTLEPFYLRKSAAEEKRDVQRTSCG